MKPLFEAKAASQKDFDDATSAEEVAGADVKAARARLAEARLNLGYTKVVAPVSATFHPMLIATADADRLRGLPIHLVHGARDWMFPVEVARQAQKALTAAGANVTYREIDDLCYTYPREINAEILQWLDGP